MPGRARPGAAATAGAGVGARAGATYGAEAESPCRRFRMKDRHSAEKTTMAGPEAVARVDARIGARAGATSRARAEPGDHGDSTWFS